jgi:23S rRNA (uridine2552-2'-O)-methyltransferase
MSKDGKDSKKGGKFKGHQTKFGSHVDNASRAYLMRQASDPYAARARKEGYRARSAYKLVEIDERHNLLQPNRSFVDLGAAPGGWCQVIGRKLGGKATIIALDKLEMDAIPGVTMIVGDFTEQSVFDALEQLCPQGVDVVLSDMAPETTGMADLDGLRCMALAELAAEFAKRVLKPTGDFVCKLFMNGEEKKYLDSLRPFFHKVQFEKPQASRADSREIYIVARGFKRP